MARIDSKGYVTRRVTGEKGYRNWWFVKHEGIKLIVCVPPHLIGKKVRFKIEVADDLHQ